MHFKNSHECVIRVARGAIYSIGGECHDMSYRLEIFLFFKSERNQKGPNRPLQSN